MTALTIVESFLLDLAALIEEHNDLTVTDLLGALQFIQQRLAIDFFLDSDENEEAE